MDLTDAYGRKIEYLRISLTDKCNLRCSYCMPSEGVKRLSHTDVLTLEEILRVSRVMTDMGVCRIRLTGGEPLVRNGIETLVQSLGELDKKPELALTTNGVLLADKLEAFYGAGLRSVNISLDTLNRETYASLTGTDALTEVLSAIEQALSMGFKVKLNAVPIQGVNDKELPALAAFARDRAIDVRFIELMPIGCGARHKGIPQDVVMDMLEDKFGKADKAPDAEAPVAGLRGPAEYVSFKDFKGNVGFISPMSHSFCESCNRVRLTVDGMLKLCLYYPDGLDVKKLIREGVSDKELAKAIREGILKKPEKHCFSETNYSIEKRSMYEIGG